MMAKEKLKILMITSRADFGGGPEHLYRLLSLRDNFNIFIAAPNDKPYFLMYQELLGVGNMIVIPHRKFRIKKLFELVSFVNSNRISIIHSHGKGAGIYSRIVALFTKSKCIHTFHGLHLLNYGYLSRHVYILLEKMLSRFTDCFVTVSKSEKRKTLSLCLAPEEKIQVIKNGVTIPENFKSTDEKFKSNKILYVSRFDYAKNSLLLVEIINEFKSHSKENRFEFHLVGDGPDKNVLENKIKEANLSNVIFHGFQKDLSNFYSDAFCYISTSRWEGLPLSLLEAMSFSTPSVVTDVDGNNDLVSNGENGYLFKLDRPQDAAEYLMKMKQDKELYLRLSTNARKLILDNYSVTNMIKQTEDLYLSLV